MTSRPSPQQPHPDHDRGLEFDVATLLDRRRALGIFGGAGLLALAGCAASDSTGSSATGGSTITSSASASTSAGAATSSGTASTVSTEVPDETQGPYPGDGSNGTNVLDDSGIIRSDITSSFGTSTTKAEGVPLTVNLTVTDSENGYAAMEGAAVYIWHCDRDGNYSMYSQGVENENYLRGVQPTNANGTATFTTIFPAAYSGRWPHIHFEVYRSTADATSSGQIVKTSQIALPDAVCRAVYATAGYEQSARTHEQTTLTSDNVFGDDGGIHQLATVTGDVSSGYVANLTIGV
ncbi:intradiol ring-cleavage dioxygenase [Knoellia subterranea]|uniref:3,4-dioxygenase subunit beta n=1 Tax=Knoellia subterranea KCTC 19937 TaxID=1385521 RepID=A0A0A0JFB1_9MICO|nr:intradiol ring-cleavage dioxygenase [Knoellia subterranea]KGN36085.1 3,4-dioxygenase subunit beta [Knoellia subterranea KCTC 19937]